MKPHLIFAGVRRLLPACFCLVACLFAGNVFAQVPVPPPEAESLPADAPPEEKATGEASQDLDKLLDLAEKDVSQLSNVRVSQSPSLNAEVTTVSRQKSTVGRSPAAVFVITQEMIRRSGARSVPEALRMAPGVNVAKLDANKWSISIRGFQSRFSNKLLVQIDGRTVYTPLFGGVFWDVQDVLLEDVDRIEIIRGPGASVWGANAVNGIINVITKPSGETQGLFAEGGAGTEERSYGSVRQGGILGEASEYRVYGKWHERDNGFHPGGLAHDDWRAMRGGFRMDWRPTCEDELTLQGDVYRGSAGQVTTMADPVNLTRTEIEDENTSGGNVLFRWARAFDEDTGWTLQCYYDRTEREYSGFGFRENRDTVDVDFQYRFALCDRHSLIWGLGYRNSRDDIANVPFVIAFNPNSRADDVFSHFIQDEIELTPEKLYCTLGCKFEHNDYTGFEAQPTARLVWTPTEKHSIWGAASRAVRTPTRTDSDLTLTLPPQIPVFPFFFPQLLGTPAFESEVLNAYEIGFRHQPNEQFSYDITGFCHDYPNLRSQAFAGLALVDPGNPLAGMLAQQLLVNGASAQSYGLEATANYQVHEGWRLYGAYSHLRFFPEATVSTSNQAPLNQLYVQSSWDIACDWQFDLAWRYVDISPNTPIGAYNTLDARLGWRPRCNVEIDLVGRNLVDSHHFEQPDDMFAGNVATAVEREFYGGVSIRY